MECDNVLSYTTKNIYKNYNPKKQIIRMEEYSIAITKKSRCLIHNSYAGTYTKPDSYNDINKLQNIKYGTFPVQ